MKKFLIALALISSVNLMASYQEALSRANDNMGILQRQGYTLKNATSGYLRQGDESVFAITLYAGNTYTFLGEGDYGVNDLDVIVYDENGYEVAKDARTTYYSMTEITPRWTGTFYVKTKMYSGSGYYMQVTAWK